MKKMKKMMALVIALVLALALAVPVFAAKGDPITATTGKITVENAAKGETYTIYKIFDATISKVEGDTAGESDSISYTYTGELPSTLAAAFEKIEGTDYVQRIEGKTDEQVIAAVTAYLDTLPETPNAGSAEAQGGPLEFSGLDFGYYGIKTTQGDKAVSVDSTNPNAVVYDKNSTIPHAYKTVGDTSYSIGDTIEYTGTFNTTNYMGSGADAKQVTKYKISDTLPAYLGNVTIKSVKVITKPAVADNPDTDEDESVAEESTTLSGYTAFNESGAIFIPWATYNSTDKTWTSIYPNGAIIEIKYEAVLTDVTNINADDRNDITITPYVDAPEGDDDDDDDDDDDKPWNESWSDHKEIRTYAAALKKVDGTSSGANGLAGAKFKFNGLTVKETENGVKGSYTVVSYDPASTTPGTEMEVDNNGMLYIVGLADDVSLTGIETEAPSGYNKLTGNVTLTPQKMEEEIFTTSGTRYYDAKGNLVSESVTGGSTKTVTKNLSDLDAAAVKVINEKGTELPSTGGIGTTIFYVIGAILVLGAGILLVTRRRMKAD